MSDQRPLRVAWLGHQSAELGGGMATYSRETVERRRARGLHVTFFTHESGRGGRPAESDDTVELTSRPLLKPLIYSPPVAKRQLVKRLRSREFDVVHASFWFSSLDFDLPRTCRQLGIPLVATFHVAFDQRLSMWGGITAATYRLYAPVLSQCTRVIVFSSAQEEQLATMGVPRGILRVLPNGVDVDRYTPGPSDWKQRLGADRQLFLYMGRVDAEKNVDVLLRAFQAVDPPAGVRLAVVGHGTERRRLQRQYNDSHVVFTGHVSSAGDRIGILRAADAFFLASSVEGLSLAMLEAMASGVAAVATDVGGDGEALRGAGIVIDPTKLDEQLELAMRTLIDMPWLARSLGECARARAVERFSLEHNVDRLIELYQEVLS